MVGDTLSTCKAETLDDHDCFVIEPTLADETVKASGGYGKKITWGAKGRFSGEEGRVLRSLRATAQNPQRVMSHQIIEPDAQRWIALRREMTNQQTGHRTVLRIDHVERDAPAPDELFTIRYLVRE